MAATQLATEWMDKQNLVSAYNGILFSLKKEILTHAIV